MEAKNVHLGKPNEVIKNNNMIFDKIKKSIGPVMAKEFKQIFDETIGKKYNKGTERIMFVGVTAEPYVESGEVAWNLEKGTDTKDFINFKIDWDEMDKNGSKMKGIKLAFYRKDKNVQLEIANYDKMLQNSQTLVFDDKDQPHIFDAKKWDHARQQMLRDMAGTHEIHKKREEREKIEKQQKEK